MGEADRRMVVMHNTFEAQLAKQQNDAQVTKDQFAHECRAYSEQWVNEARREDARIHDEKMRAYKAEVDQGMKAWIERVQK